MHPTRRRVQHAVAAADLQLRGDATPSTDEADWDRELIHEGEAGLAFFDGGSYSRGPIQLGAGIVLRLVICFGPRIGVCHQCG